MKNISISFILLLLMFSACTEEIDLDLNDGDNQKLVVDAWIDNSGRQQFVELSLTANYFDDKAPVKAMDATVTITGGDEIYELFEDTPGRYLFQEEFAGTIGTDYQLKIDYNGVEYIANHTLNRGTEIDALRFEVEEEDIEEGKHMGKNEYLFYVNFQEPAGEGDSFYFNHYKKGERPEFNIDFSGYGTDDEVDGAYFEDIDVTFGYYNPGDTVVVQLYSISESVFDYFLAIEQQTDYDNPLFGVPPANVQSNISGEARGYFIVSAIDEKEIILTE